MKTGIFSTIMALTFIFSACNDKLTEMNEPVENQPADTRTETKDVPWSGYILQTGNHSRVIIDGRELDITKFRLVGVADPADIRYAYCANMNIYCYPGSTYHPVAADTYFKNGEDKQMMTVLSYIVNKYGWLETANPIGYDQLMQCAIWGIIHNCDVTRIVNDKADILEMYRDVFANYEKPIDNYDFDVTLEGEGTAHPGEGFTDYGPFWVSESSILESVHFTLTFVPDDETAIFVMDDEEITAVKPAEQFYVRVPAGVIGDFNFTAEASAKRDLLFVNDYNFYVDERDLDNEGKFDGIPSYQPVIQPITNAETSEYFYSCSGGFTVRGEAPDVIIITCINWNNGNGNGNGGGINQFTVNGITLKNNKNYLAPANFDAAVAKAPGKKDPTAIYTVLERTVFKNGKYVKVYDVKVAFYENGAWKSYAGTITVDNPGGNDKNQKIELVRIF